MNETLIFIKDALIACVVIIVFLITLSTIFGVLDAIRDYFREKTLSVKEETAQKKQQMMNVSERLAFEDDFIKLIDYLIQMEVSILLKEYTMLNVRYNVINLDRDVESVSNNVFAAIKNDAFVDVNHLLTKEYLMALITKQTMIRMLLGIRSLTSVQIAPTE